jgi:hypothetical protein
MTGLWLTNQQICFKTRVCDNRLQEITQSLLHNDACIYLRQHAILRENTQQSVTSGRTQ